MKQQKDNRGFTLLEMVIAIAIISILMSAIVFIFPQWLRQYEQLKKTAKAVEIMDSIASAVQEEMKFSQDRSFGRQGLKYLVGERISAIPLDDAHCSVAYDESSHRVRIEGKPKIFGTIFDTAFYGDMTVLLVIWEQDKEGESLLMTQIEVYSSEGNLLCSVTRPVVYYNP